MSVTSQTEHVITAAHSKSLNMSNTIKSLYKTGGLTNLILPPGMAMMVCREIPFAAALFYIRPALSKLVSPPADDNTPLTNPSDSVGSLIAPQSSLLARGLRELGCGCVTSLIASPVSHVPSVLAAYQQGHGVSLKQAYSDLLKAGGGSWKELWRGLGPRTASLAGTMTVVPMVLEWLKPVEKPFDIEDLNGWN